jgi:hypothetical protein
MRRALIVAALVAALVPAWAAKPAAKVETFKGKVVPLAELLAKDGGKLDADAAPHWLALVTDDGKVFPLVKDVVSRMFFKDKALLNRPMQLTGRVVAGSTLLRVGSVSSVKKGELYEVYYWCNICSIRRGEKMICECCGGPMELNEDPVKK